MILFIVLKFMLLFPLYIYGLLDTSYLNDYLYDFSAININVCAGNHLYDYGQVIFKTFNYMFIVLLLFCSFQDCLQ